MNNDIRTNNKSEREMFESYCGDKYEFMPSAMEAVERIIVIGDIHGDWDIMVECLKIGGVINDNMKWIGGKTHVVQVGDQVDRCRPYKYECDHPLATIDDEASDIKIMKFLTELDREARKDKGRVINLIGNHELKNIMGDMAYVSFENIREFSDYKDPKNPEKKFNSALEARIHSFRPGNEYANFMACTRQSIVVIGSNIFIHAGLLPEYMMNLNITTREELRYFNTYVRKFLLGLINEYEAKQKLINSKSLFWNRVFGILPPDAPMEETNECQKYLKPILKMFKVDTMIIGHTVQFSKHEEGINSTCSGGVYRVDNGASKAFDAFDERTRMGEVMKAREAQVLEIIDDKKFRVLRKKYI